MEIGSRGKVSQFLHVTALLKVDWSYRNFSLVNCSHIYKQICDISPRLYQSLLSLFIYLSLLSLLSCHLYHYLSIVVQLGREPYFRSSFQASSTPKGCALSVY